VAILVSSAVAAKADPVLDWNAIAVATLISQGQSPFAQARVMAITQLAVFEAVNAITRDYEPSLGTVGAPAGARADAAAIAAAYRVLRSMASSDALVASFWTKYHYQLWRPETAIRRGAEDGNSKTDPDPAFVPYIATPCFPSWLESRQRQQQRRRNSAA
jgi:hypothetical protein